MRRPVSASIPLVTETRMASWGKRSLTSRAVSVMAKEGVAKTTISLSPTVWRLDEICRDG